MSFLSFTTGRATLRRLHQRAHRNISRQHQQQRFESSNNKSTNSSPSARATPPSPPPPSTTRQRTIPGPAWTWIELLAQPFRAYSHMQNRRPLLTQLESTLIIYWLGDLSAQTMQTSFFREGTYEPARGLRALAIGGLFSIPSYRWFLFLGDHFNYKSHLVSIAVKIVVNQTVFTPVFNTFFFGMQSLLSGDSLRDAKRRVLDTVPVSWRNSWKVWPVVTAFSFTFVAPKNRSVFAGVIAIFWQTYLSWLNKNAEEKEGERQGVQA